MKAENKLFRTVDLCALIRVCKDCGVSEMEFGDLWVSFATKCESQPVEAPDLYPASPAPLPEAALSEAQIAQVSERNLAQAEFELKQAMLEEMILSDPLAYQNLAASGELEDDASSGRE